MRILAIAAAMAVALLGCSMVQQAKDGEAEVAQFHQMLDAGQYEAIYTASAPGLQSATPQEKFVALMSGYHARMGNFQSGKLTGTQVDDDSQGDITQLTYAATYDNGTATEKFVFERIGGEQLLREFSTHDIQTSGS